MVKRVIRSLNRVGVHDIRNIPRISHLPNASFDLPRATAKRKKRRNRVYLEYIRAISWGTFLNQAHLALCKKKSKVIMKIG